MEISHKYQNPSILSSSDHVPEAKMWIQIDMRRCIASQKVGVFFPHLVTTLCRKASALMTSIEQFLKQPKSITGDTLFQQYTELRTKQMKHWNKKQQKATATPAPLQREEVHENEGEGEDKENDGSEEMDEEDN
ncbi:hypothetical protein Gotur_024836 [Gossypium turneri]